jgi:hypothetical protein
VLIDEVQVFGGVNYQGMLAELRKYGGSFALATQSLSYLDRFDRTLRPSVLANVDHIFAFDMSGEDARLLHELDGIEEEDITNLDDFQCYVKLSLGGRRLPVFSLNLDPPPIPDSELAQSVRLRSQQRDARPAGVVDEMLQQAQVRQRRAAPTQGRRSGMGGQIRQEESAPYDLALAGENQQSIPPRRKKKRGSGGKQEDEDTPEEATAHIHLMYGDDASDENDERNGEGNG